MPHTSSDAAAEEAALHVLSQFAVRKHPALLQPPVCTARTRATQHIENRRLTKSRLACELQVHRPHRTSARPRELSYYPLLDLRGTTAARVRAGASEQKILADAMKRDTRYRVPFTDLYRFNTERRCTAEGCAGHLSPTRVKPAGESIRIVMECDTCRFVHVW